MCDTPHTAIRTLQLTLQRTLQHTLRHTLQHTQCARAGDARWRASLPCAPPTPSQQSRRRTTLLQQMLQRLQRLRLQLQLHRKRARRWRVGSRRRNTSLRAGNACAWRLKCVERWEGRSRRRIQRMCEVDTLQYTATYCSKLKYTATCGALAMVHTENVRG